MILFDQIKDWFRDYFAYIKEQKAEEDRVRKAMERNNGENLIDPEAERERLKELVKMKRKKKVSNESKKANIP